MFFADTVYSFVKTALLYVNVQYLLYFESGA